MAVPFFKLQNSFNRLRNIKSVDGIERISMHSLCAEAKTFLLCLPKLRRNIFGTENHRVISAVFSLSLRVVEVVQFCLFVHP